MTIVRSKTPEELRFAKRCMVTSAACTLSCVGALLLLGFPDYHGFPKCLWTPRVGDLSRALLAAAGAVAAGSFFVGAMQYAEHEEATEHPGETIVNPPSTMVGTGVLLIPIGLVLIVRYLYLLALGRV